MSDPARECVGHKCRWLGGRGLYDDLWVRQLTPAVRPRGTGASRWLCLGSCQFNARGPIRGAASRLVRRGGHAVHQHGSGGIGDFAVALTTAMLYLAVGVLLGPHQAC